MYRKYSRSHSRDISIICSSQSDELDSADSENSDYEAYKPAKPGVVFEWKLHSEGNEYAEEHFHQYIEEPGLKDMLQETPPPGHKFLKVPELDQRAINTMKQDLPLSAVDATIGRDKDLQKLQSKII